TPGMFTAAILTFIFAWNDFLFAISLTSSDRARTAPAAIAFFNGNSQFQQPTGSIAAAAVVITVPIIVMVLLFQRRIVSGLTSGDIRIGDEVVTRKAPRDRNLAMVFQNYALYPHLTVRENMAFPLKLAKMGKADIAERVEKAASILELEELLDRKPANLSGG